MRAGLRYSATLCHSLAEAAPPAAASASNLRLKPQDGHHAIPYSRLQQLVFSNEHTLTHAYADTGILTLTKGQAAPMRSLIVACVHIHVGTLNCKELQSSTEVGVARIVASGSGTCRTNGEYWHHAN